MVVENHVTRSNPVRLEITDIYIYIILTYTLSRDDDVMDLGLDNWSGGHSLQIDVEMAYAGDSRYAEVVTRDIEMGNAEPEVADETHCEECPPTPRPDVAATLEASVCAPITTQTQTRSVSAETPNYETWEAAMYIHPIDLQLAFGNMSTFFELLLDSLNAKPQATTAIPSPLVSATDRQPMVHEPSTSTEQSPDTPDRAEVHSMDHNSVKKGTAQSEGVDSDVDPTYPYYCGAKSNNRSGSSKSCTRSVTRTAQSEDIDRDVHPTYPTYPTYPYHCGAKLNNRSGSSKNCTRSVTRTAQSEDIDRDVRSTYPTYPIYPYHCGAKSNNRSGSNSKSKKRTKSVTRTGPSRAKLAVDMANTRLTFGTEETSGPHLQSSAPSTALRVEISSHTKSIPELSKHAALQLDKGVETQGFWSSLWNAFKSLF